MKYLAIILLLIVVSCSKPIPTDEPITIGGQEIKEIKK